mmetsp:Transcript_21100/g.29584  ORF Transcript_21100/g.29584 Transcript_21100/m.29584 type:complete len:110 (+) Transcript_21100:1984-2313(+)
MRKRINVTISSKSLTVFDTASHNCLRSRFLVMIRRGLMHLEKRKVVQPDIKNNRQSTKINTRATNVEKFHHPLEKNSWFPMCCIFKLVSNRWKQHKKTSATATQNDFDI